MKINIILFTGLKIYYKTQNEISGFKRYWISTASTETEQRGNGPWVPTWCEISGIFTCLTFKFLFTAQS